MTDLMLYVAAEGNSTIASHKKVITIHLVNTSLKMVIGFLCGFNIHSIILK